MRHRKYTRVSTIMSLVAAIYALQATENYLFYVVISDGKENLSADVLEAHVLGEAMCDDTLDLEPLALK